MPALRQCDFAFYDIFDFINIALIIGYYILTTVTEVFIYPNTAVKRRMGFIDNSIGSKLLDKPLKGYFSNDSIPYGSYKLGVNCYENCFFSYNIAKAMTLQIAIKNSVFFLFFLGCAYFGFQGSVVATPIIQIFLSTLFLNELIHHLNFCSKLKKILDLFQQLFAHKLKPDDLGTPIFFMLDYETVLAFNKSPLSDKKYQKLNSQLSIEWEELKKRYEIK
ncbi:hypothetical protein SDC9_145852 [bioreactor metagenome]|uniref:Uncharacterized protein n=1 Tax=bioreactor metagenome TaxID=1076179 RepID=A0A645E9I3_9ZZZZ